MTTLNYSMIADVHYNVALIFRLLNCKSLYSNNKELTLLLNTQFGSATLI